MLDVGNGWRQATLAIVGFVIRKGGVGEVGSNRGQAVTAAEPFVCRAEGSGT
ncbi:hypothetical protein GCM10009646_87930 [Streptomyces aureus]